MVPATPTPQRDRGLQRPADKDQNFRRIDPPWVPRNEVDDGSLRSAPAGDEPNRASAGAWATRGRDPLAARCLAFAARCHQVRRRLVPRLSRTSGVAPQRRRKGQRNKGEHGGDPVGERPSAPTALGCIAPSTKGLQRIRVGRRHNERRSFDALRMRQITYTVAVTKVPAADWISGRWQAYGARNCPAYPGGACAGLQSPRRVLQLRGRRIRRVSTGLSCNRRAALEAMAGLRSVGACGRPALLLVADGLLYRSLRPPVRSVGRLTGRPVLV
jgi:hypothetical protein